MIEAAYSFMVGLPTLGWFFLILSWSTISAAALAFAVQGDMNRRDRKRKALFGDMDGVADKLDEVVRYAKKPLPAWCPKEFVDKYREEIDGRSLELSAAVECSDALRVRLMGGKVLGSAKLIEKSRIEANRLLVRSSAARRRVVRSASVSVAGEALSVIERRVGDISGLAGVVKLPPMVASAVSNDLSQIAGKAAIFREALDRGDSVTRDGLVFLLKLSVDLHLMQDLVVDIISRTRSAPKG